MGAIGGTAGRPAAARTDHGVPPTAADGEDRRRGRELNRLALSLGSRVGRTLFLRDELTYIARFGLTREETRAVVNRDWRAMLDLGGHASCLVRIAAVDSRLAARMGAAQRGIEHELFVKSASGRR